MTQVYNYQILAQVYGGGAYDSSTYQQSSTSGGGLSDTGIAIASIVTLAALILLAAIVVRIWKRPRKQAAVAEVVDDERDDLSQ
ncbi:MAG TPA: hypothetical protein VMB52_06585 [Verrucomicrobiae bacterium]|nr:hypothetical protein [Verrucomicrobiae bacterium]